MSSTPSLPFYAIVTLIVIVNVLQLLVKYLTGTWLVIVDAILLAATIVSFEYGINTAVNLALSVNSTLEN
jgi:hypothetical protein